MMQKVMFLLLMIIWRQQSWIHQILHDKNAQNLWTCTPAKICDPPKLTCTKDFSLGGFSVRQGCPGTWVRQWTKAPNKKMASTGLENESCSPVCWINTESCWRPSAERDSWLRSPERARDCPHPNSARLASTPLWTLVCGQNPCLSALINHL